MKESVVKDMLVAQRRCFDSGATRPLRFRREMLTRLELALIRWEGELLEALRTDFSKPPYKGYMSKLDPTLAELRFVRGYLKKWTRPVRHPAPLSQFPSVDAVCRGPCSMSLILAPWNHSLLLTLVPLVSVIAVGYMAVVKPGEDAPASVRVLAEVPGRALPPEYVTVVEGRREEMEALMDKPFNVVLFTGSPAAGKEVIAVAAKRLTPVTLGLGGRSPVVLTPDTDVELAVARIVWDKFLNVGQTCVAPDHIWVPGRVAEPFMTALTREIIRFYSENPPAGEELPRIVNRRHFDRLAGLLSGGQVVAGGQTDSGDLRIAPAVLMDVPEGNPVLEEEIFGPVLPVLLCWSLSEPVKAQRQRPRPLAFYLFARSRSIEQVVLGALPFGGGCINDTMVHLVNPRPPSGEVGNSDMGACHGKAGLDAFTRERSVLKRGWPDTPIRCPSYRRKYLGILKRLI